MSPQEMLNDSIMETFHISHPELMMNFEETKRTQFIKGIQKKESWVPIYLFFIHSQF